jgi:hypothetical protein
LLQGPNDEAGHWTNAWDRHQSLADDVVFGALEQFFIRACNLLVERLENFEQPFHRLWQSFRSSRGCVAQALREARRRCRRDLQDLRTSPTANGVDESSARINESGTHSTKVPSLPSDITRHMHRWKIDSTRNLAKNLRVSPVRLDAARPDPKTAHQSRWDHPNFVSMAQCKIGYVKSFSARLEHDTAVRLTLKKGAKRPGGDLLFQ